MRRYGVNLLLVAEVLVLIFVLVLGVAFKIRGVVDNDSALGQELTDGSEDGTNGENNEQQEELPAIVINDNYIEQRISFSETVEEVLSAMSTEEKVYQLFMITPEALTGYDNVTVAGNATKESFNSTPVGGLVYAERNLQNEGQVRSLTGKIQEYSMERVGVPLFLAIDESKLASKLAYDASEWETRVENVQNCGFNMVFSTLTDTNSNAEIAVVNDAGMNSIMRFFPGEEGATLNEQGIYVNGASLEAFADSTFETYKLHISEGLKCMMLSNVIYPSITADEDLPCTLSWRTIALLRENMGFQGVIVSDDFSEEAFVALYGNGAACVEAIKAGVDMIYMPADFEEAYQAVLDAVNSGNISEDRLNNAVGRILTAKGL